CSPHDSECSSCDSRTSHIEGSHCHLESSPVCSEYIGGRHSHILEGDGASVRASLTHHLLLLSPDDSGCISINDECSECLSSR
ncbi:hypothetical protein PENTCL1PPCAC_27056, partial [Pristionchus entomophagus]